MDIEDEIELSDSRYGLIVSLILSSVNPNDVKQLLKTGKYNNEVVAYTLISRNYDGAYTNEIMDMFRTGVNPFKKVIGNLSCFGLLCTYHTTNCKNIISMVLSIKNNFDYFQDLNDSAKILLRTNSIEVMKSVLDSGAMMPNDIFISEEMFDFLNNYVSMKKWCPKNHCLIYNWYHPKHIRRECGKSNMYLMLMCCLNHFQPGYEKDTVYSIFDFMS